ncbi:hypothetical protein [Ferruginibacter sp.]|nr:hypothetical protein [Ferruginibacter sp.]
MKKLLFLSMLFISVSAFAQKNLPSKKIQLSGGYSRTGSGDMPGYMYGAEYAKYFKKKTSWAVGFNGFIYDGSESLFSSSDPNKRSNGKMRYTTAGLQINSHLGISIIRNKFHELQFRLGALVKYQSASIDGYAITYPVATNYPEPVVTFYNYNPQRTIAAGGSVQVAYNYTIKNKISIGFLGGVQTDSEGDLIYQTGLTFGRKF